MKRRNAVLLLLMPLVILVAIAGWNYLTVQRPLTIAVGSDSRNEGIFLVAHYEWFLKPDVVVFDLRSISGSNSETDVIGSLLQFAQALQNRNFDKVVLSYKGEPRFMLDGDYFKQLGEEYGSQNVIYTLRTLPEHVLHLDGTQAFGTWTGGWLGVVGHQMDDLNSFGRQWFLSDAISGN
jgi:hypothetical protein